MAIIRNEFIPLIQDSSGALRIGQSRVLLELVIRAFQDGVTPETIVQRYPSTTLADIYAIIAYYLRYPQIIETYLAEREDYAKEVHKKIENKQKDLKEFRSRLLSQQYI